MSWIDRGFAITVLSLLVILGSATGTVAQPAANRQAPVDSFADSVDVRVVNLEVVVTDSAGERVTGLGPDDFVLKVKRKKTSIDYFTEVREGIAIERSDSQGPREAQSISPGGDVPTKYLVFIDGVFGFISDHARLAKALDDQLGLLGPKDEMAIVIYEGTKLVELSGWTQSSRQLSAALRRVPSLRFEGMERLQDLAEYRAAELQELEYLAEATGPGDEGPPEPMPELPELRFNQKKVERMLKKVSTAAVASMHRYSGVNGRKAALLWSGGWPFNSVELFEAPQFGDAPQDSKTEAMIRRIADTANRLGYTLYSIDTPRNRYDSRVERLQHSTLDVLAEETGGRALKNSISLDSLSRAAEDTRTYYWLGFNAKSVGDGARYDIEVKTRQSGLTVRSRSSYLDLSRQQEINDKVEAIALIGEDPHDYSLNLEFGEPKKRRRRAEVPLTVGIPLAGITMLPSGGGYSADLEVRISAVDPSGAMNEIPIVPLIFEGPKPKQGDIFFFETSLKLRRVPHDVTVAVYDRVSGSILVRQHKLEL